ncbi:MAG: hypothetical protein ABI589_14650 [Burkholderiales bacterium]
MLNGQTRGKFVLFGIPAAERVEDGPVMRGLLETDAGKINVAGWKKIGRDSGAEYLSLKVGNTKPRPADASKDTPEEWVVGPFYGRLFKEVKARDDQPAKVRYFGFIEDSVKVGEDESTGKGVYRQNWQLQIGAKPDESHDGKTRYINGTAHPAGAKADDSGAESLPF